MDELKIRSTWTKRILACIIEKHLLKKYGYKINLMIDELRISINPDDNTAQLRLGVGVNTDMKTLNKIIDEVKS